MAVVIRLSNHFYDELVMSIADTFEPNLAEKGAGTAREDVVIALRSPARVTKHNKFVELSPRGVQWLHMWLGYEAFGYGRWCDWGREGVPLERAGQRVYHELDELLERNETKWGLRRIEI